MNSLFWERAHGGLTHFPIALIFAAALFDALAFFRRPPRNQRSFKDVGYWLVILGALGSLGAVFSGLALSKWTIGGTGAVLRHHLFVWPAFALVVGLATWRFLVGDNPSRRAFGLYLATMIVSCAFIGAAGFFGGEMLLGH
ncbi:MAG: hypothetical protein DME65_13350 [Verrucomicrobia bacterium]|nr:MAG: hypothetical protein DME65_13350 [Verrucomicrobiota bacterium]